MSSGFPFIGGHDVSAGIAHVVGRVLPLGEGVVSVYVFGDAVHDGVGWGNESTKFSVGRSV